jgi:hypothetical protein
MQTIELKRFWYGECCTGGLLLAKDFPQPLFTLELPWKDNKRNVSCIPEGNFRAFRRKTVKNGKYSSETYEVAVPDRTSVLFHVGNTVEDSRGCILLGFVFDGCRRTILSSGPAVEMFMQILIDQKEFQLKVTKV